jgi:cytidine deaminase
MKKEKIAVEYQSFASFQELDSKERNLVEKALEATKQAYAPYSEFYVGAAVLLKNGEIILGSNQENGAYPSGLCAERVALFYAGHAFPNEEVEALAVIAHSDKDPLTEAVAPCGACRQVMHETQIRQKNSFKIILAHENGSGLIFDSIYPLLPLSFHFNK